MMRESNPHGYIQNETVRAQCIRKRGCPRAVNSETRLSSRSAFRNEAVRAECIENEAVRAQRIQKRGCPCTVRTNSEAAMMMMLEDACIDPHGALID